ncbi:hypothetical protein LTR37_009938 [Vermiconidia calcicola]|uniref:Uncharacterized protein n=1 Tax=Vermiconidia calcicola TaxID=1690605 RepID=A0ACC3N6R4_9PEZI|nr:hypothetical protein LTR37_009938 [Vermiconidia calcicola]
MSTDIAGLREQIIANAFRVFPEKAALRETLGQTYPSGDNFNISVTAIPDARCPKGSEPYQATLIVLRASGQVETLLKGSVEGRAVRFEAKATNRVIHALEGLLHETAVTLMK